jgi:RNA polymerase-associated protein CTR9
VQLLLVIEAIDNSKNPQQPEEERLSSYDAGTKYIERAFNGSQRNAVAANALCDFLCEKAT